MIMLNILLRIDISGFLINIKRKSIIHIYNQR